MMKQRALSIVLILTILNLAACASNQPLQQAYYDDSVHSDEGVIIKDLRIQDMHLKGQAFTKERVVHPYFVQTYTEGTDDGDVSDCIIARVLLIVTIPLIPFCFTSESAKTQEVVDNTYYPEHDKVEYRYDEYWDFLVVMLEDPATGQQVGATQNLERSESKLSLDLRSYLLTFNKRPEQLNIYVRGGHQKVEPTRYQIESLDTAGLSRFEWEKYELTGNQLLKKYKAKFRQAMKDKDYPSAYKYFNNYSNSSGFINMDYSYQSGFLLYKLGKYQEAKNNLKLYTMMAGQVKYYQAALKLLENIRTIEAGGK